MIVFNDQFAFTINTSHHKRLVKTWERLSSVLDFMGPDEYTTIVPLVEGVEEDLKAVVEDIEELAEEQSERRDTVEAEKEAKEPTKYAITEPQFLILEKAEQQLAGLFSMANEVDGDGYASFAPFLDSIGDDISSVVSHCREGGTE